MNSSRAFGRFLRKLRTDQGMTLQELVGRAKTHGRGITAAYVSLLESGRKPPPREPVRAALAKALGVIPEKIEAAARGKLHRPLLEVLKENRADPALVAKAEAESLTLDDIINVMDVLPRNASRTALVIALYPDGKASAWAEEDLK